MSEETTRTPAAENALNALRELRKMIRDHKKTQRRMAAFEKAPMPKGSVNWDGVTQVYTGRIGSCVCGCSGKHYKPTEAKFNSVKSRIIKHIENGGYLEIKMPGTLLSMHIGKRLYIAYFDRRD
jgi:hypothetical protein